MCGKFAESKDWQKKRKEKAGSNFGGIVVGLSRRSNGNSKISTFLEAALDKRDVIVFKKNSVKLFNVAISANTQRDLGLAKNYF